MFLTFIALEVFNFCFSEIRSKVDLDKNIMVYLSCFYSLKVNFYCTNTWILWQEGSPHLWRRAWQPTLVFLPGKSHGQRSWWATVPGVAQSWTWWKWQSSRNRVFAAPQTDPFLCRISTVYKLKTKLMRNMDFMIASF